MSDASIIGTNNYSVYRHDRLQSLHRSGGVLILTNNYTVSSVGVVIPADYADVEAVAVDLIGSSFSYRFVNCYRKPSSADRDINALTYTRKLIAMLQVLSCTDASLIVLGDYNLPAINWSSDMPCQPVVCVDDDEGDEGCCRLFSDFLLFEGLYQFVGAPTRSMSAYREGNILDLVISNDIFSVSNLSVDEPFSTSDHCCIRFDILYTDAPYSMSYSKSDYIHADWDDIMQDLNAADWSVVTDSCYTIESRFNSFYDILNKCVAQHVPSRMVNKSSARSKHIRYPAHIAKLLTSKRYAWRLYRTYKTPQLLAKFKLAAAKCRSAIYQHTLYKEEKLIETGNLGKFYRHCNKSFRSRSNVGSIRLGDGSLTNNPTQKACAINDSVSFICLHCRQRHNASYHSSQHQ